MKICFIIGTRPEIIKMSPVVRECIRRKIEFFILHTNQHYSENLDSIFFSELELPEPKYNLNVGSGTHAEETAGMMIGIEKVLMAERPGIILVEGDTNTVLAGALTASKLGIKTGHIEAGLRSYFRGMPEEINRIIADHCSDMLFAPTLKAKKILIGENIPSKKIFVTGNTIVDAVMQNMEIAGKKAARSERSGYFLATVHREENVDNKQRLSGILSGMEAVSRKYGSPVVYPVHPRARKMISSFGLNVPGTIEIIQPVGYFDFLILMKNSAAVLTDSGGIQEEACVMKVPCITLRDNTERPETLDAGSNILAGAEPERILKSVGKMVDSKRKWKNPFGDGKAGEKIISEILKSE